MILFLGCGLLGLMVGSFLNVVIYRLPLMMQQQDAAASQRLNKSDFKLLLASRRFNLAWPPSFCPNCKQQLRWWHNIPLLSFVLLKGRCYYCAKPISWRYPLVELITLLITIWLYIFHNWLGLDAMWLAAAYLFSWILLVMVFLDLKDLLIPDELSLTLLWLGLFFNGVLNLITSPSEAILGAISGYLVLWLIALGYSLARDREGLGFGDLKFFAALGAWFGASSLPRILLISSLSALIVVAVNFAVHFNFKQLRYLKQQALPFGPYLALAGFIELLTRPYFSVMLH